MFDWSIGLGNILTIVVLGAGGIGFVYTLRGRVDGLSARILLMEKELTKMVEVLVQQGRHDERMAAMDLRLAAQGQRLDDLTRRFNYDHNGRADHP